MGLRWQVFLLNLNRWLSDCRKPGTTLLKPISHGAHLLSSMSSFFSSSIHLSTGCHVSYFLFLFLCVQCTYLNLYLFHTFKLYYYCTYIPFYISHFSSFLTFLIIPSTVTSLCLFLHFVFFNYSIIYSTAGSGWKDITSYGWTEKKSWCLGQARPIYLSGSWCSVTWGNNAPGHHKYSFTSA